jgi:hypothetical protein
MKERSSRQCDYSRAGARFLRTPCRPAQDLAVWRQVICPKMRRGAKIPYDFVYVKHQPLALDLYLIAQSFWISFRGKWETRNDKV